MKYFYLCKQTDLAMDVNKFIKVLKYLRRHKYMVTFVMFLIIIGFIDENNLIMRINHQREIVNLKSDIEKYREQYENDTERLKELTSNPQVIEKVAREKYLMKKPNEDIFIIENE